MVLGGKLARGSGKGEEIKDGEDLILHRRKEMKRTSAVISSYVRCMGEKRKSQRGGIRKERKRE
jgi:hypothetical protein